MKDHTKTIFWLVIAFFAVMICVTAVRDEANHNAVTWACAVAQDQDSCNMLLEDQ